MNSTSRRAPAKRKPSNVVLVGMPGSGKSTIGVILAKMMSLDFVDTDVLIQTVEGRSLQDIVDSEGHMVLRKIEERVLLGLDCRGHVVATGGSAAYSDAAMRHLGATGAIVFLDVDLPVLVERVGDFNSRGLAKRPDQTFADLFNERKPLYLKYADVVIRCGTLDQDEVCAEIIRQLREAGRKKPPASPKRLRRSVALPAVAGVDGRHGGRPSKP